MFVYSVHMYFVEVHKRYYNFEEHKDKYEQRSVPVKPPVELAET